MDAIFTIAKKAYLDFEINDQTLGFEFLLIDPSWTPDFAGDETIAAVPTEAVVARFPANGNPFSGELTARHEVTSPARSVKGLLLVHPPTGKLIAWWDRDFTTLCASVRVITKNPALNLFWGKDLLPDKAP